MVEEPKRYDFFISFSGPGGSQRADDAYSRGPDAGLVPFLARRDIEGGETWPPKLRVGLDNSDDLLLLWDEHAAKSKHVRRELDVFDARTTGIIVVVMLQEQTDLPQALRQLMHAPDLERAIYMLTNAKISRMSGKMKRAQESLADTQEIISGQLDRFLYKKVWKGFFSNGADSAINIFTCGRNVTETGSRGKGGRTQLDFWDFQTVCDIHSFTAREDPQTNLQIVRPASKAEITPSDPFDLGQALRGKDCIIIGSPDVSDYAELAWARLHGITPWSNTAKKSRGFVIRKCRPKADIASAVYRMVDKPEDEGVALVDPEDHDGFEKKFVVFDDERGGTTYGILVLAENPCDDDPDLKVMILSGFTGIATNALACFLTDPLYKDQLFELDRAVDLDAPIEVLLEVKYEKGTDWENREDRKIRSIRMVAYDYINPDKSLL